MKERRRINMDSLSINDMADYLYESTYSNQECLKRTYSGRYYYFIYHKVKEWLETHYPEIFKNMGGSSHEKLRFCMEHLAIEKKNKNFHMLALKLGVLHQIRVHADYHLDNEFTVSQVMILKKEKDRVCQLLEELVV